MSLTPVDIQILGRSLKFNCPAEQVDAFYAAANDVNSRLQTIKQKSKVTGIDQLLISVALNLSFDLAEERLKDGGTEMVQRAQELIEKLDKALSGANAL